MKPFSWKLICIFFNIMYVNSELQQQPLLTLHNNDFGHGYVTLVKDDDGWSNASDTCFVGEIQCDPGYKFRSFNGSCNNLKHPTWGMANTAFTRLFPAAYSDGEAVPPTACDGFPLPNARKLSLDLFDDLDVPDDVSLLLMQFGQFITHDMAISVGQSDADCSSCSDSDPHACIPVSVSQNDPLYSLHNVSCLRVTRSKGVLTGNCEKGPRQQENGVTHVIDASQVYGSDEETAMSLRSKTGGKLKVREVENRSFLIQKEENTCTKSPVCYKAGDGRVNQNLELAVLQTVFLREHNRIAAELASLHPTWDDERLYQETRAILVALIQHIIYNHYLPHILGDYVEKHKLDSNYEYKYNEDVMNLIINCFTAATFRVLHSGIQGVLNLYNYKLNPIKSVDLVEWVNSPGLIEAPNYFDGFLVGLMKQKMQKIDPHYNKQMNGVFPLAGNPIGVDLSAIDIQRGRDHGLPSYTTVLAACAGVSVREFDELRQFMSAPNVNKLASFYSCAEDIDLFVGVNFETRKEDERLGLVGKCILSEQFYRLKYGDRFWHEIAGQPHSFTPEQLAEIKKASLARIICDNSDEIVNVTPDVFRPPSLKNKIISCKKIPAINLTLF